MLTSAAELSEFMCATIALTCSREKAEVDATTTLMELNLDSLTFVAVLAQVEAAYDIEFVADDMLELISVSNIGELTRTIDRVLRSAQRL